MEHTGSYDFAEAFARFTCVLEDAAGVAAEGQAAGLPATMNNALVIELEAFAVDVSVILAELREALAR